MSMKSFLKQWNDKDLKKMEKDERTELLYEFIPSVVSDYIKKGHSRPDEVNALFDRMEDKKFSSNLLRILKTHDEGDPTTPVDLGMATIIADFIAQRHQKLDEETIDVYNKAINKILKKRIKKGASKTGLEKGLIKELLVVVSEPDAISNPKFMGIYVNRVLNKLYALARDTEISISDTSTLKKLFKFIFGKESLNEVAVNILLEYRDKFSKFNSQQQAMWNIITTFALETLEGNDKKEIRTLLEYYIDRRKHAEKRGHDRSRRIQFASINKEDYPKILKAVNKLSDKDEFGAFLA